MSLTVAAIGGVVTAAVKYLLVSKGMETAATKAAEKIGQLGGEALVNAGKNAFAKLREALGQRGEPAKKAQKALADVEEDPTDEDYQRKFATELEKLAQSDTELRTLLEQLSAEVEQANATSGVHGTANVSGDAKVYGSVVGTNPGTITGTYSFGKDDD